MDIHKPKPWHGVREFLKEYAIIVVGVLTALAAEQVAELAHVHNEVREARAALHAEMADDLRTLVLEAREDACYRERLAAIAAWADGKSPKPPPGTGLLMSGVSSSAWETAKAGAAPHMELKERLALSVFYNDIENQMSLIRLLRQQVIEVSGYRYRESLDPQEAHALIRLAGDARTLMLGESRNVGFMLAEGHEMGVEPGPKYPEDEARVDKLCAAYPPQPLAEAQ
jgi:hypothetical protein